MINDAISEFLPKLLQRFVLIWFIPAIVLVHGKAGFSILVDDLTNFLDVPRFFPFGQKFREEGLGTIFHWKFKVLTIRYS